jgi:hypothetical protein
MLERNSDVTVGRTTSEAYSATWNLGAFTAGPRKTTENFDLYGLSLELPDAK